MAPNVGAKNAKPPKLEKEQRRKMKFAMGSSSSDAADDSATDTSALGSPVSVQTPHSSLDIPMDAHRRTTPTDDTQANGPAPQVALKHTHAAGRCSRSQAQLRHSRALLAALLSAVLVISGVLLIGPALEQWQSVDAALELQMQLARLDNSVQLLSVDTVKVVQRAKQFLKQHQRAQISSSARTQLIARAGDESYATHARERFESHSLVMREAIVFQSSQKLRINDTRARLLALNISLPAQRGQKKSRPLPTKVQLLQLQHIHKQQQELESKIVSLVVDAAQEAVIIQEEQRQRANAKFLLDSLRQLENQVDAHNARQKSKNGGAFFLYAFVVCLTGGYLWTAAAERKRRAPVQRERPWSPIPTFMVQIKDLFKAIVVIEDIRKQQELLADASDAEDDLGNIMVRTFVTQTAKPASKSSIPSSATKFG